VDIYGYYVAKTETVVGDAGRRCWFEQLIPTAAAKGQAARSQQCSVARTDRFGDREASTQYLLVPSVLTQLLTHQLPPTPAASSEWQSL